MLIQLTAQAEARGADLVTLRALIEEASELGAARALASLGLDDPARAVAPGPILPGHGLSFGYRVRGMDKRTYRELMDLELIEISLVTHPMQPLARVIAVDNQGEDYGV
jgi:hypothetical protein